jgi:hypothetical protein
MADITHIGDLTPDPANARKHNPRNVGMIEDALGEVGAARSIVIDEDGVILAGNATIEAAAQAGIERVQVVEADGETIVAVRRSGLTDEQKKRLALFDNRTAELAEWDTDQLLADIDAGFDFDGLFYEDEIDRLLGVLPDGDTWADAFGGLPDKDRAPFRQMTFTLHDTQADSVVEALKAAKALGDFAGLNENSNGNALARICEMFMAEAEHGIG